MATRSMAGETLFFIPDISGFTRFVNETEIEHSQHIIRELLEALVDANAIGLEVSEFEGDAVLFYRPGAPPPLTELVEQARRMFVGFHTQLKRFQYGHVCQCGACAGTHHLGLKFVAHAGACGSMPVKDRVKLIGRDVIVAHRLLKNSVPEREYLLLSQRTLDRLADADAAAFTDGADAYDELGEIAYRYLPMAAYLAEVRFEPPPPVTLDRPQRLLQVARRIAAPAEQIYGLLIDLPARARWVEGVKAIEFRDDTPNHVGKVHRCVRDGDDPEVVTGGVHADERTMEFTETDTRRRGALRYLLTRRPDGATDVMLEFFVGGNALTRLLARLTLARKLQNGFEKSLANLARECETAPQMA